MNARAGPVPMKKMAKRRAPTMGAKKMAVPMRKAAPQMMGGDLQQMLGMPQMQAAPQLNDRVSAAMFQMSTKSKRSKF